MKAVLDLVEPMGEDSEPEDEADQKHHQDQKEADAARLGRAAAAHFPLYSSNAIQPPLPLLPREKQWQTQRSRNDSNEACNRGNAAAVGKRITGLAASILWFTGQRRGKKRWPVVAEEEGES